MRIIVTFEDSDDIYTVDVSQDMTLGDLCAFIESESGVSQSNQIIFHNARVLEGTDKKLLQDFDVQDDDMMVIRNNKDTKIQQQQQQPTVGAAVEEDKSQSAESSKLNDIERVRLQMLGDVTLRDGVRQSYPELADAVHDEVLFRNLLVEIEQNRVKSEEIKRQELKRLNDDPFNEESQKKILEIIQQEAVMENLEAALEHHPEAFGRVTMLYIDCQVNGHKVKAFVDSGAQATIMSPQCAQECNIMHLIDKRFAGIARGVGTAKILGRVHSATIKIGMAYLTCNFTVMEGRHVGLLLGLDMLKRHQACIDLKDNVLRLPGVEGGTAVPFLPESDIPKDDEAADDNLPHQVSGIEPSMVIDTPNSTQSKKTTSNTSTSTTTIPPQQQQTSSSSSTTAPTTSMTHPEELITQIQNLGFTRQEAIDALNHANGDVDFAASLLFS